MPKKKRSGGLFHKGRGATISLVVLFLVLGAIYSVAKENNIHSTVDFIKYMRSKSNHYQNTCLDNYGLPTKCLTVPEPKKPSEIQLPKITVPDPSHPYERPQASSSASLEALNALNVAERDTSSPYSRKDWKHWIGSPCNTRETALKEYGSNVVVDPKTCKIKSGSWLDAYGGETITDPKSIDVDHIIPLKAANMLGGASWTSETKQRYANDPDVLIPVSAKENRSKSDKGPSDYMPPNSAYHCEYAKRWVSISIKYNLNVTPADKKVLTATLQGCKE